MPQVRVSLLHSIICTYSYVDKDLIESEGPARHNPYPPRFPLLLDCFKSHIFFRHLPSSVQLPSNQISPVFRSPLSPLALLSPLSSLRRHLCLSFFLLSADAPRSIFACAKPATNNEKCQSIQQKAGLDCYKQRQSTTSETTNSNSATNELPGNPATIKSNYSATVGTAIKNYAHANHHHLLLNEKTQSSFSC